MDMNLPVIAGTISTIMFGISTLPMLTKAFQTKDLRSYSLGHILLANGGNVVHSVYVFDLPPGPIWILHTFYLVTTGLMLVWYLRYERRPSLPTRLAFHLFAIAWSAIPLTWDFRRTSRHTSATQPTLNRNTPPTYPIRGMRLGARNPRLSVDSADGQPSH